MTHVGVAIRSGGARLGQAGLHGSDLVLFNFEASWPAISNQRGQEGKDADAAKVRRRRPSGSTPGWVLTRYHGRLS